MNRAVILGTAILGSSMLALAILTPNSTIEEILLGSASGELGWGATLFRALLGFHGIIVMGGGFYLWQGRGRYSQAYHNSLFSRGDGAGRDEKWYWLGVGLLCLLALGLRLFHLGTELWHDEILTLLEFVRLPIGETVTSFPSQNQHMLYTVLAKPLIALFGESAWSVRLPAALFGVASIWALYLLGRRVLGSREALLACALMTLSYHHVWFSQNARGYTGILFFTVISTWLWLEALPRKSLRLWLAYAFSVALGMWTHLTMAFVVASHGLVSLILLVLMLINANRTTHPYTRIGSPWQMITAFVLCVTVTLQLYALALPDFLTSGLHEESRPSEWTNALWLIVETIRGLMAGFSGTTLILGMVVLLIGAFVLGAGWGKIFLREWPVAIVMVLPGILIIGVMVALGHNLWPRFLFFSAGFAIIVMVHGIFEVPRLILRVLRLPYDGQGLAKTASYSIYGLIFLASAASLPRNYAAPKQDYLGALSYVESERLPADAVVVAGLANYAYIDYYHANWIPIDSVGDLLDIQNQHENVWFIFSLPVHFANYHKDLLDFIENRYQLVKVFPGTLSGGEIYVYRVQKESDSSESNATVGGIEAHNLIGLNTFRNNNPCNENVPCMTSS